MEREAEELCDSLTDVFSRVETTRVSTSMILDRVISQFGERFSSAERECSKFSCPAGRGHLLTLSRS
jgi:hypothetical protein